MTINTIKLLEIFSSSQGSKKENWIDIPDSKEGTIHPNVIGDSGGETHNGWKIHISIDPEKIATAAKIICEILNEEKNAPKVSIKFSNTTLAKTGQPSKQIAFTFYQEELSNLENISRFLNNIETALDSAGICPDSRKINTESEACKTKFDASIRDTEGKPTRFNYRNDQCIIMEDALYIDCGGEGNITQMMEQIWVKQSYYLSLDDKQKYNPGQILDPFSEIRIKKPMTKEASASAIIVKRHESPIFSQKTAPIAIVTEHVREDIKIAAQI